MKFIYYLKVVLIISFYLSSCTIQQNCKDKILIENAKDSVLHAVLTKYPELPKPDSDSIKLSNFYNLKKSIFNINYGVTLELLIHYSGSGGWNHKIIYVTNGKNINYAFPYIDNYYIWEKNDSTLNKDLPNYSLILEKEINQLIKVFKIASVEKNRFDQDKANIFFNDFFTCLLDNKKIYSDDIYRLNIIANFIKYKSPLHKHKTQCQQNVLGNINSIINDIKDTTSSNKIYFTNDNFTFYQLIYPTQEDTSHFVKIKILNAECYFKMLY